MVLMFDKSLLTFQIPVVRPEFAFAFGGGSYGLVTKPSKFIFLLPVILAFTSSFLPPLVAKVTINVGPIEAPVDTENLVALPVSLVLPKNVGKLKGW